MTLPEPRTPTALPERTPTAFPAVPDPTGTPQQDGRWETARRLAEAHPGTRGHGGWTVERLPSPTGTWAALAVLVAGGAGAAVAVFGLGGLAGFYCGLAVVLLAGLAALAVIWHLPPADLRVVASTTRSPRPDDADHGNGVPKDGACPR